jgi:hypothetical protein
MEECFGVEKVNKNEIAEILFDLNLVYYSEDNDYQLDSRNKIAGICRYKFRRIVPVFQKQGTPRSCLNCLQRQALKNLLCCGQPFINPFCLIYFRKAGAAHGIYQGVRKKHGKKNMIEGSLLPERNYILFTDHSFICRQGKCVLKWLLRITEEKLREYLPL